MDGNFWVRSGSELLADISNCSVPDGAVALWYLGQMGLVVKGAGTIVYLDPYLVESWTKDVAGRQVSRRRFPPPFRGEDVYHADVVCGTHNHSDHINTPTLTGIALGSPHAEFIVPAPFVDVLTAAGIAANRVTGARTEVAIKRGAITITPIPAAHEELVKDNEGNYEALCYVLDFGGVTVFHAGDTVDYPGFVEAVQQFRPDICMLPINGRDALRHRKNLIGNMNFREAADVGFAIGAKLLIPGHYDVFPHNSENPAFLADYLYRAYPNQPYKIMVPGERLVYMR